jgi:transcriptional regulator NrdR family protein
VIACPTCGIETSVIETRTITEGLRTKHHGCKRIRVCGSCQRRFTTIELIVDDIAHARHLVAYGGRMKPRQEKTHDEDV